METHWVRPQWALSIALHATLGVVASVLALSAPAAGRDRRGGWRRSRWRSRRAGGPAPLRLLFPRRATQNVLVVPDEQESAASAAVTLLICARYDAPRGGLITRDGPRRLGARLRRRLGGHALGPRAWVALALAAVAACAGLRALDVEGGWLGLAAVRADGRAARSAGGGR